MFGLRLLDERLGGLDPRGEPLELTGDGLEPLADRRGQGLVGVGDPAAQAGVDVRVERVGLGGRALEATAFRLEVLAVTTQGGQLLARSEEGEVGRFDLVPAPQRLAPSARFFRSPRPVWRICFAARFFRKPGTGNAGSISTV